MKLKIGNLETNCLDGIEEIGDAEASRISGGGKFSNTEESLTLQPKFSAETQLFNMTANGTSTLLKTVGEGITAIAREQ